ncbi:unnamed protein product [Microthlaspi erraticum]|uniref:Non-specific lipid-transfer protein n=1 Tax=Microthlaspi erraticum TaxID=1685480 RepID=A0A6D2KJK8_9BRAS|nr:unnamed protein product [Microthlaspi erraticum]
MAGAMKLACVFLACMIVAGPITANATLTCGTVVTSLSPCRGYLTLGGPLPRACCTGVSSLEGLARTTPDRRIACSCIKQIALATGANPVRSAGLPRACKVTVPYPISASTDCSKVK